MLKDGGRPNEDWEIVAWSKLRATIMKEYTTIRANSKEGLVAEVTKHKKNGFDVFEAQYVLEQDTKQDAYIFCQNMARECKTIVVAETKPNQAELDLSFAPSKREIRRKVSEIINAIEGTFTAISVYGLVRFWRSWPENSELNKFISQEITNRTQRGEIEVIQRHGRRRRICTRKRN